MHMKNVVYENEQHVSRHVKVCLCNSVVEKNERFANGVLTCQPYWPFSCWHIVDMSAPVGIKKTQKKPPERMV